jgi:multidrug efflux system outer membrane protein
MTQMHHLLRYFYTRHVKPLLATSIVCCTLLILPSCAIPHLRQPETPPTLPESFNGATSPDSSAQLGVDEFFNDSLLTQLINQALLANRELKILNEEAQVARNEILARQGAYLPFITFGARGGMDRASLFTPAGAVERQIEYLPGKHFPDPVPNVMGSFNLFWQLDIWRELRNARDAATQRYFAATERRNYFASQLIADTAENYYHLMALDKRMETLEKTIEIQEKSLKVAQDKFDAGKGTELAIRRFEAEVRKNRSEKLIVAQEIIEVENRINVLVNRFPQPVERNSAGFFDLNLNTLSVGVPSQLLQYRADIRQAEREVEAAGFDVLVARAHFFPRVDIMAGIGYEAFNPRYLFNPEALIANAAGNLAGPVINKKAIQAEFMSANARQLESIYNYQRVVLIAFTEVINRISMVDNYGKSIAIKRQQLESLEASVDAATKLFQNARVEYVEVLLAQRDYMDARMTLIETKKQQLSAIVNAYQALGGGGTSLPISTPDLSQSNHENHTFRRFWNFWTREPVWH